MKYRPDIDGLRAIAVISVLIYHLDHSLLPGGFVGVDVFFVISGFVVTGAMSSRGSTHFLPFLFDFYARRLARIIPALVLTLVITSLAEVLLVPVAWLSQNDGNIGLAAFFGISNLRLQQGQETYFTPRLEYSPFLHTWSLGVEEQFYLVAPFALFLFFRKVHPEKKSKIVGLGILIFLSLASLVYSMWVTKHNPTLAFYSAATRFFELSSGVLLYLVSARHPSICMLSWHNTTGIAGLLMIAFSFLTSKENNIPWPSSLLPVAGGVLLIGGAKTKEYRDLIRRFLSASPLVWLGKRSYALYLWHWPVDVIFRWTVGLETAAQRLFATVLAVVLAMISSVWIEKPLRHNAILERQSPLLRILFFVALTLAGAFVSKHLFDHRQLYSLSTVSRFPDDWYVDYKPMGKSLGPRQCSVQIKHFTVDSGNWRRLNPTNCSQSFSSHRLFVIGDSHALMLIGALAQSASQLGITVDILHSCTFFDYRTLLSNRKNCSEKFKSIQQYLLKEAKPGDAVLIASLILMRYADQNERFHIADMYNQLYQGTTPEQRKEVISEVENSLEPLKQSGLKIILWAPPPIFKVPTFRCVDFFNQRNPVCSGNKQTLRSELAALREPIMKTMSAFIGPQVSLFDPFPSLCPAEICSAIAANGRPLFFDGDHLSQYGNEIIYPTLKQHLIDIGISNQPPNSK